jgi:hypothetical protein
MRKWSVVVLVACLLAALPAGLFAQSTAAPANRGFATVKEILVTSCSGCHDWTDSYESVMADSKIAAGNPDKSRLYQRIADDSMPAAGDKLTAEQKAFIKGWIAAGAPSTDLPIAVPGPAAAAGSGAGSAAEAAPAKPAAPQGFLFFPSKVVFHEVTGFTSTALLLGAGAIGAWHLLDMMEMAHIYRDNISFTENSPEALRIAEIQKVWGADSALRWWHVGLLIGGETLYLGDALTGISMFTKQQPGKLTKHDIHRYAFFTHAALMAAQVGLGFAETWALSTGNHDLVIGIGAAHAAIGITIPLVMLGAGLENIFLPE